LFKNAISLSYQGDALPTEPHQQEGHMPQNTKIRPLL